MDNGKNVSSNDLSEYFSYLISVTLERLEIGSDTPNTCSSWPSSFRLLRKKDSFHVLVKDHNFDEIIIIILHSQSHDGIIILRFIMLTDFNFSCVFPLRP